MGEGQGREPADQAGVIQIELRLDGVMPTGVATASGGVARAFSGWMGLMSAVDALSDDGGALPGEDER